MVQHRSLVLSRIAVSEPPLFDAVTVYTVEGETTLGVPLIPPFVVSKVNPDGRFGEIAQVATGPPVEVGLIADICRPTCSVNELVEYVITGTASLTSIVTIVVALPPVLVAVTV